MQSPSFQVEVSGQDVSAVLADGLVSITVTDERGYQSDEASIVFTDLRTRYALPRRGQLMTVALGYGGANIACGTYHITKVSVSGPQRRISVAARATPVGSKIIERRSTAWPDGLSLADITRSIANRHGLIAAIHPEAAAIIPGHLNQQDESDLNLLTRLGALHGLTAKVQDQRLILAPVGRDTTVSGLPQTPSPLTPSDCDDWILEIEDRDQVTAARAAWINPANGRREEVVVGSQTPDARTEVVPGTKATEQEALSAARARLNAAARNHLRASLSGPGRPEIRAEGLVVLAGFPDAELNGEWKVEKATHTLSGTLKTTLTLTPPTLA